jgi:hypothetical protein
MMTTRTIRTHAIMDAYRQHHGNRDRALLKKLGLSASEMKTDSGKIEEFEFCVC